ncbi:MAG TPA: FkbM family methyltransferase [Anaerolineales bacterium]|nr:FkbM family methyltransferase [Anaerolineales bacterium]
MLSKLKNKISENLKKRWLVPSIPFSLQRLKRMGVEFKCCFDVGAYRGEFTVECMKYWKNAQYFCFEPVESHYAKLKNEFRNLENVKCIQTALGSQMISKQTIFVRESASSLLDEHYHHHPTQICKVDTIKNFIEQNNVKPDFIKLDVQGYELEILKGADSYIESLELILIELNFIDIHRQAPLFLEVTEWLGKRNFVAFDICGITRRPLDNALWQADFIFLPENSKLRSDKRYSIE